MTAGLAIHAYNNYMAGATEIRCTNAPGECTAGPTYYTSPEYFPVFAVTLGTTMTLEANGNTYAFADPGEGHAYSILDTYYGFRFLEAERVTPVGVSTATPEPATWGLISLSLGGVALLRRKRA